MNKVALWLSCLMIILSCVYFSLSIQPSLETIMRGNLNLVVGAAFGNERKRVWLTTDQVSELISLFSTASIVSNGLDGTEYVLYNGLKEERHNASWNRCVLQGRNKARNWNLSGITQRIVVKYNSRTQLLFLSDDENNDYYSGFVISNVPPELIRFDVWGKTTEEKRFRRWKEEGLSFVPNVERKGPDGNITDCIQCDIIP